MTRTLYRGKKKYNVGKRTKRHDEGAIDEALHWLTTALKRGMGGGGYRANPLPGAKRKRRHT